MDVLTGDLYRLGVDFYAPCDRFGHTPKQAVSFPFCGLESVCVAIVPRLLLPLFGKRISTRSEQSL